MTTLPRPTPSARFGEGSAPILSVEDLFVEFRTRESTVNAVNGISYTVSAGETLAILGESGSGKSVSAQAIMGILDTPPAHIPQGEIWFEGRNLLTLNVMAFVMLGDALRDALDPRQRS